MLSFLGDDGQPYAVKNPAGAGAGPLPVLASFSGTITVDVPSSGPTGAPVPADGDFVALNLAGLLQGWTAVQPSGAVVAGQVDLASVAGTTAATGNGPANAGTLRVTTPAVALTGAAVPASAEYQGVNLAGNLTGRTAVQPAGGVVAAATDVSSVAGTTAATGNGVTNAGTQRFTLSSDSTGQVKLAAGAATIGNVGGVETAGAAATGGGFRAMGVDTAGNARDLLTTPAGALIVNPSGGPVATYSAAAIDLVQTASGVSFQMKGSATKTVAIKRVIIAPSSATVQLFEATLYRTTTASAGTPTGLTAYAFDSSDAAATAVATSIATPGALGTIGGIFGDATIETATATVAGQVYQYTSPPGGQDITLRGVNEWFGVRIAGSSFTGAAMSITVEWIEY